MKIDGFWIYLLIMAGSTYLIRTIPFAAVKNKIKNRFIRSFLHYIPYTALAVMTFPAAFYATGNIYGAAAGIVVAVILALFGRSLTTVALFSCCTVFVVSQAMCYFS